MNYDNFVACDKSLLIAPAGYGKTYTISKCLEVTHGTQLILTHTHAGVAALRERLSKSKISQTKYYIETISGFAKKYVHAFYNSAGIKQPTEKDYFNWIIPTAKDILSKKIILDIVINTYAGLFVDEYQDCTIDQHALIMLLSNYLPTRLFGDPLQGIFNFSNQKLVDLQSQECMGDFLKHRFKLDQPNRWIQAGNSLLGEELAMIRALLEKGEDIHLEQYKTINYIQYDNIYCTDYKNKIFNLLKNNGDILIIDPNSSNKASRINFIQQFNNIPTLIESIDDTDFYKFANAIDTCKTIQIGVIYDILKEYNVVNITELKKWVNRTNNKFVNKTQLPDKEKVEALKLQLESVSEEFTAKKLVELFEGVLKLPNIKLYREELMGSIYEALINSEKSKLTISEEMTKQRDRIRKHGRAIRGKLIGSTLLVKGLETETVVVLNAHAFTCPKNLYVAFTRASKKLYVFSKSPQLSFKCNEKPLKDGLIDK